MPQTAYKGALPTVKRKKSSAKPTSSNDSGTKDKVRHFHKILCFFLGSLNKKCQCPTLGFATPKPTIGFLHRSQAHNGYSTVLQAFHATLFYYLSFHV